MHRVKKQIAIIFSIVLLALSFASCKDKKDAKGKGDPNVVATINGKPINLREVDFRVRQKYGEQFSQLSPIQLADERIKELDWLIQQEVLFQRAESEKLMPSEDEVTQAINVQKTQNRMTEEEYQQMLRETGETEQALRERARKTLAIQKLVEKAVGKITIKDNEVVEFFNNNPAQFVNPRAVMLSAIVVDPTDSKGALLDDAKNDFDAQNKANEIHAQLERREDFATLARKRSEDASAANGGEIGVYTEERLLQEIRLPQDVVSAMFGQMPVGDYTKPIRLLDGRYYIFKLTDRRLTSESQSLDSPGVKDRIKAYLIAERQRIMGEALRIVALSEAKIINKLAGDILKDPATLGGMTPAQPAPAGGGS